MFSLRHVLLCFFVCYLYFLLLQLKLTNCSLSDINMDNTKIHTVYYNTFIILFIFLMDDQAMKKNTLNKV